MTAGPPDPDRPGAGPTSRDAELAAQQRWRLRPAYAKADWFTRLIDAEFADAAAQRAAQEQALGRILAFAQAASPCYRQRLGPQRCRGCRRCRS